MPAGADRLRNMEDLLNSDELIAIAQEAYIWGYPLVQTWANRDIQIKNDLPVNRIVMGRDLLPGAPNPCMELLYGYIALDLTQGPQVLTVPACGDRYYSFQFHDLFTNPFYYVASRTTGSEGGQFVVCGPQWQGELPDGLTLIQSPCDEVLVMIRIGVKGEDDVAAANAFVDGCALGDLAMYPYLRRGAHSSHIPLWFVFPLLRFDQHYGPRYFDILCERLQLAGYAANEQHLAERFARVGIGPGRRPSKTSQPEIMHALCAGIPLAERRIESARFGTRVGETWDVIYGYDSPVENALLRAISSRMGIGYHVAEECLYYHCRVGSDGTTANGQNRYRLRFPAGQTPPVEAFWSLLMMTLDQNTAPNAINRHAISNNTPGLEYGVDGSLELAIQYDEPAEGTANWLPAPAGSFMLTLRLYVPGADAVEGRWVPPRLDVL